MSIMRPPTFVRPLAEEEQQLLMAGLRSRDAFTLRRSQILLASAEGQRPSAIWLRAATKKHRGTSQATAYLQGLRIPALSKTKKDGRPGWRWRGPQAPADATMSRLEK
jgi:hypothetical protein